MTLNASKIDAHVGLRMRQRRELLGISQSRLGRHLGLTFSQVQKYEKGSNRIGSGRLFQISEFLGVPPSYFFEGLRDASLSQTAEQSVTPMRAEVQALHEAFGAITEPEVRASVLALLRALGHSEKVRHSSNHSGFVG